MKTLVVLAAAAGAVIGGAKAEAAVFQKSITSMTCDMVLCAGSINVPAGKVLTLQTMSCVINFSGAPAPGGRAAVGVTGGFSQFLSFNGNAGKDVVIPVSPVPQTVTGPASVNVVLVPDTGAANIQGQTCNLRGVLK